MIDPEYDNVTEINYRDADEYLLEWVDTRNDWPTPTDDGCGKRSPANFGCTRKAGHSGPHIATTGKNTRRGLCSVYGTDQQWGEIRIPKFTTIAEADAWLEGHAR